MCNININCLEDFVIDLSGFLQYRSVCVLKLLLVFVWWGVFGFGWMGILGLSLIMQCCDRDLIGEMGFVGFWLEFGVFDQDGLSILVIDLLWVLKKMKLRFKAVVFSGGEFCVFYLWRFWVFES